MKLVAKDCGEHTLQEVQSLCSMAVMSDVRNGKGEGCMSLKYYVYFYVKAALKCGKAM
jgi:hypothetical protein